MFSKSTVQIHNRTLSSLHASIKEWYAGPDDQIEVNVDGYLIDLVKSGELIEIQTGNFRAIKQKLEKLLQNHHLRLVYPVARERWIVRTDNNDRQLKRRKSPKRGRIEDLFDPLVSIPTLISHPALTVEVLFTQEEVVWKNDGRGGVAGERCRGDEEQGRPRDSSGEAAATKEV